MSNSLSRRSKNLKSAFLFVIFVCVECVESVNTGHVRIVANNSYKFMFLYRTYPSLQRSVLFVAEANDGAVVGCIGVKVKQASSQVDFAMC